MRSWVQCCKYHHPTKSFDEKETDTDEKLVLNEKLGAMEYVFSSDEKCLQEVDALGS